MGSTDRMLLETSTRIDHRESRVYTDNVYEISVDSTLDTVDLEEGDALPEDSTSEIISSHKEIVRDRGGAAIGAHVKVTAMRFLAWED